MAYNRIGVFGATGLVGSEIVRALAEEGFDVVPFSRRYTTVAGIPTQKLQYLEGFDVIIAAIGQFGIGEQRALIQRAKKDGVKRFIPSEFGFAPETDGAKSGFNKAKREIFQLVEGANFPDGWTAIACGFLDCTIPLFATAYPITSAIEIRGDGDIVFPWTVRYDVGRVLAYTLKNPPAYKNTWLRVANEWLSLRQIAEEMNKKAGTEYEIISVGTDSGLSLLHVMMVEGRGGVLLDRGMVEEEELPVELSDLRDYIDV